MQQDSERRLKTLIREIEGSRCVVFIGAGLSREADVGLPTGSDLAHVLAQEGEKIYPNWRYDEHASTSLEELAQDFEEAGDYHYALGHGRKHLLEVIQREVLPTGRRRYGASMASYQFIASITQLSDTIVTTNWDELLEYAIKRYTRREFVVLTPGSDVNLLNQPDKIKIIKLHGTIGKPETIRVTRRDLNELIANIDQAGTLMNNVSGIFLTKTVIFAGYGLRDRDFDFLYQILRKRSPRLTPYAIITEIRESEQADWQARGIAVIRMPARMFFQRVYIETSEFINRDKHRKLQMLEYYPYYEINGYAGLGKSTLLRRIYADLQVGPGLGNFVRCAYYRFEPKDHLDPTARVDDFQKELARAIGGRVESLENIATERAKQEARPRKQIFWELVPNKVDSLVSCITNKTLLLIDTTSTLQEDTKRVLEQILLRAREQFCPLYVIVASRYPMPWNKFKLKALFHRERLPALQTRDIAGFIQFYAVLNADEYLEPGVVGKAAQELEEITQGHPGAIQKVLEAMTEDRQATPFTNRELVDYIRRQKADLAHLVVREVVEKILQDLTELAREVFKDKLCMFRRINHSVVQELGYTKEESTLLISDLEKVELAKPPAREVLWVLDPIVRQILVLDLKLNKRTDFDQLNNRAKETFEGKIHMDSPMPLVGTDQVEYMIEALYHYLVGWQAEQKDQDEARNQLRKKLGEYVKILRPSLIQTREDVAAGLRTTILEDQEMLDLLINVCGEEAEGIVLSITVQERPVEVQEV